MVPAGSGSVATWAKQRSRAKGEEVQTRSLFLAQMLAVYRAFNVIACSLPSSSPVGWACSTRFRTDRDTACAQELVESF